MIHLYYVFVGLVFSLFVVGFVCAAWAYAPWILPVIFSVAFCYAVGYGVRGDI